MPRNIINAIGGSIGLAELEYAFKIEHHLVSSVVTVTPDPHNHTIAIEGEFVDREGNYAGRFVRKLEGGKDNVIQVMHGVIEVEEAYQRKGIARQHYRQAFAVYIALGVSRVYMSADFAGPYVWQDFGFEFEEPDWDRMLARYADIHRIHNDGELPDEYPETAAGLAHSVLDDGFRIGEEAIRAVHDARGELKMVLDLGEQTIQRLRISGIVDRVGGITDEPGAKE